MRFARHLSLFAGLAMPSLAQGDTARQPPAGDRLIVCNKVENTVSIFAVAERRELVVLATGIGPHEVAVAPDGCTAVVTNYGNGAAGHTLTVIDLITQKVCKTIDLRQTNSIITSPNPALLRPHGLCFYADHCVIVTNEASAQLLLIDVLTGQCTDIRPTPQKSIHLVSVTQDGLLAAASSFDDGSLVFFDLATKQKQLPAMIKTGKGSEGLTVHPVSGNAWVCNRSANTVSIVSAKTGKIVKNLITGDMPRRIAATPDHKLMLVTCIESGELMIFDASEQKLLREVTMHGDRSEQSSLPLDVVSGPDSRFAYVTCARGEFVAIIDLSSGQFIDRIDARKGPDGIAYARPRKLAIKR